MPHPREPITIRTYILVVFIFINIILGTNIDLDPIQYTDLFTYKQLEQWHQLRTLTI